jgi:hypothetical protein
MSNETETKKEQTNETLSNNDVLDQTRLRSHDTAQRPIVKGRIIKTLVKLKTMVIF